MAHPTNTRFSIAVHLLTLLAEDPAAVIDSRALATSPATNPVHVRRVLGLLRERGLVRSQAGAHGGWSLTRPATDIDLGEVWRAVNRNDAVLGIHVPEPNCPVGRRVQANLHELDRRITAAMVDELAHVTVAEMTGELASQGRVPCDGPRQVSVSS